MIRRVLRLPLHALQEHLRRRYTQRARAMQAASDAARDAARAHGLEAYARTLQDQASAGFAELIEEMAKRRAAEMRVKDLEQKLGEVQVQRALAEMKAQSLAEELAALRETLAPPKKRLWS